MGSCYMKKLAKKDGSYTYNYFSQLKNTTVENPNKSDSDIANLEGDNNNMEKMEGQSIVTI